MIFDVSLVISEMIYEILRQYIPMESYLCSESVFYVIANDAKTT